MNCSPKNLTVTEVMLVVGASAGLGGGATPKKVSAIWLQNWLSLVCRESRCSWSPLHGFLNIFVSKAFPEGATEAEVKDWVGHTDSRIVRRYLHGAPVMLSGA